MRTNIRLNWKKFHTSQKIRLPIRIDVNRINYDNAGDYSFYGYG